MRYVSAVISILVVGLAACDGPTATEVPLEPGQVLLNRSAESCDNIRGTVTASFVEGQDWDIQGTLFDENHVAIGDAFAWLDDFEPRANGAIAVSMRHRYVIDGSELDTEDRGVLSPRGPPVYWFNNRLEVVGGTEAFADAQGIIRSHGTVDLASGAIQLAYHGRVCR